MEITDVKIYPVSEKKVKAYASVVFDECFIIRDLKVIDGDSKLFVAMPRQKDERRLLQRHRAPAEQRDQAKDRIEGARCL